MNLPNVKYSARKTEIIKDDKNYLELKSKGIDSLKRLVETEMPNLNFDDLNNEIKVYETLAASEQNLQTKNALENKVVLLKDLNKLMQLEGITIPQENGNPQHFCILAEAAGGVTEKLSLIPLNEVKTQLKNLQGFNPTTLDSYSQNRDEFKLSTKAILKLPKHGSTIEVQREAIALNISRILGFNTTKSTAVEHNGKAALFVPFDPIQLLKEVAMGEEHTTILPSSFSFSGLKKIGEKYLHYSTVVPVGNQLNADQIINDFGHIMAFSYLCNDTDFIGMENQNKAIKGCDLYIFDQVVMTNDKMEFDSRLNLIPVGWGKHSRHNQGRNRSLIEDSSFDSKLDSISNLLNHQEEINLMLDYFYFTHFIKTSEIKTALRSQNSQPLQQQLNELTILLDDVTDIKKTINDRIKNIFQNFPTINDKPMNPQLFSANKDLIKHSLMLEKLVNKPVLFANDGRPYKNPWTYRNTNKIDSIKEQNGMAFLSFSNVDVNDLASVLKQLDINIKSCKWSDSEKTLGIPTSELEKIHENNFFPEHCPINPKVNYLENFFEISSAYPEKDRTLFIELLNNYQYDLNSADKPEKQIKTLSKLLDNLYNKLPQEGNPGLLKHLELTIQMHTQQQLRKLLPELAAHIAPAFEAALKLDRVKDFNAVLLSYAQNPHQNKVHLIAYFDSCIGHAKITTDYNRGKIESLAMQDESSALVSTLNLKPDSLVVSMKGLAGEGKSSISIKDEDWEDDFVIIEQESRKNEVANQLEKASHSTTKEEKKSEVSEEYTKKSTFKI